MEGGDYFEFCFYRLQSVEISKPASEMRYVSPDSSVTSRAARKLRFISVLLGHGAFASEPRYARDREPSLHTRVCVHVVQEC